MEIRVFVHFSLKARSLVYFCSLVFNRDGLPLVFMKIQVLLLLFFLPAVTFSQGVKGTVIDEEGKPLAFTTIYISETGSGSVTNLEGKYELRLKPGTYHIHFQFLGYKSEQIVVNVGSEMIARDVVMQKQAYLLQSAEVDGGTEDPAYKIMRKAIAKSNYHRQQVDHYTCEVYLKGGGRVVDAPWLLRRAMKEGGMDTSATFVTESVSEITYNRPGEYTEKVISIRTIGDDRDAQHMLYINASFYEPEVGGAISPFSPKAFAFYRFRYIRSFEDRGYQINEIEVIPRSRSTDTFAGKIFVIEDLWAIHSVELRIVVQGIQTDVNQVFAPVEANVWLPISHKYNGSGKIMGIKFEFQYLATVSDYVVKLNQNLSEDIVVLDEKTEQEEIDSREKKPLIEVAVDEKLMQGGELTRKEIRQLMREYEKQERKKTDEPQVVRSREIKIDSSAYERDSAYWALRRPVKLTEREIKGYNVQDSIAAEVRKKEEGDTLSGKKFKPANLIFGSTYDLGNGSFFRIKNPITTLRFNTVDGWNFKYGVSYYKKMEGGKRIDISPTFRYGFARDKGMGKIETIYRYGQGLKKGSSISLAGGYYYDQFNKYHPIATFTDAISSLFVKNHFMRVYDKKFVESQWNHRVLHNLYFKPSAQFAERIETFNHTDYSLIKYPDKEYDQNAPMSLELPDTHFGKSRAFKIEIGFTWQPGATYYKTRNVYTMSNNPPEINFTYEKAIPGIYESTTNYNLIKLEGKYGFDLNRIGRLNMRSEAGVFLRNKNMDFMDYAHFMGNQTIFTRFAQMRGYSIAPYYKYSTNDAYLSTYVNWEMRRFLFTNIPILRLVGTKENININHIYTPNLKNYVELGYSIDNLFRFFRIDVTGAFLNGKYDDFRIQIGITTDLISIKE